MPDSDWGKGLSAYFKPPAPGNKLPGFHHGLINPCIGNIMFNKGRDPDAVIIFPLAKGKSIKSQKGGEGSRFRWRKRIPQVFLQINASV